MLAAGPAQQASEVVAVIVVDDDRAAIHSALVTCRGMPGSSRGGVRGIKRHRYLPELIDGVPTATRMESTIENTWHRVEDRKAVAAEMRDRQAQSDDCKALTIDPGRQVAIDSAFQRLEG